MQPERGIDGDDATTIMESLMRLHEKIDYVIAVLDGEDDEEEEDDEPAA